MSIPGKFFLRNTTKDFFELSHCISIKLFLRRTLVQSKRYSTKHLTLIAT